MKYINIYMLHFNKDPEYDVASATIFEESKGLLAAGFEYVSTVNGIMLYRRLKKFSAAGTPIIKRKNDNVILK